MHTRSLAVLLIGVVLPSLAFSQLKVPFEVVRYKLPQTAVSMKASLTLESCTESPIVSGEATIVATASVAPAVFSLNTQQLQSSRIKRTLNISLQDTGTIATIDSNIEDRTAAIIGNAIKFAASVAGSFISAKTSPGDLPAVSWCDASTQAALARVHQVDAILKSWRTRDLPASPREAIDQSKAIDALAAERAALRIGVLHVDLEVPIDLQALKLKTAGDPASGWVAETVVEMKPLREAWLGDGLLTPSMTINWLVKLPPERMPLKAEDQPASTCQSQLDARQGKALCFVTPLMASFSAIAATRNLAFKDSTFTLEAKKGFPVSQWGTLQLLELRAGFGSNKQLSLSLDKFGQVSTMKWTSEARAETVTSGLAGIAGQVSGVVTANDKLTRQKAEIDELTTQQTLNRVRACQEILAAGGSACPADAVANLP